MKALLITLNFIQLVVLYYFSAKPALTTVMVIASPSIESKFKVIHEVQTKQLDWSNVETADYKVYVANLRLIGCPEETIRDIISADLDKHFSNPKADLDSKVPLKFWEYKPSKSHEVFRLESWKKEQELTERKRLILNELLGYDNWNPKNGPLKPVAEKLSFLTQDEKRNVLKIIEHYTGLEKEIYMMRVSNGELETKEDGYQRRMYQKDMLNKIRQYLSPEKFELYLFWMSETGNNARRFLSPIKPTEQDFRYYFSLFYENDIEFENLDSENKTLWKALAQRKDEARNAFKQYIGEEKYLILEKANDDDFKNAHALAEKNNLSFDIAEEVYRLKREWLTYKNSITDPSTNEGKAKLELAKNEIKNHIQTLMGQSVYTNYLLRGYAGWLR